MVSSLGEIFKEKFLSGKSANELTHSLKILRFKTRVAKSMQYIRLIFIGRVNRTMTFQYSELIYLQLPPKLHSC